MAEKQSEKNSIKVIRSDKLSSLYDNRFVVIDVNTREVLDDAQGYGYKTKQKAYAAFYYKKNNTKSDTKRKKALKRIIEKWLDKNEDFKDDIEYWVFQIVAKGCTDVVLNEETVNDLLKHHNAELKSFSVKQLLEYFGIK